MRQDGEVEVKHLSGLPSSVLEPGETMSWMGAPDPKVIFAPPDVFLVPLSAFFLAVALVVFIGAILAGAPTPFVMLVGFGLAATLYAAIGRFFYKRYDRKRTAYLITDRRALAVRRNGTDVRSVEISQRPSHVDLRVDGVHGVMRWGGPLPAEDLGQLIAFSRRLGLAAGSYWPGTSDQAAVSFWDVDDFDALRQARSRSFADALNAP